jgi:uncharacterized membrane protein YqaE (UPF0057 family)
MDVTRGLGAILLPPLGLVLEIGRGGRLWFGIPLKLLGHVRESVPAAWIIARR